MTEPGRWDEFALVLVDVQHDFHPEAVSAEHPGLPAATGRLLAGCPARGVEGTPGVEPLDVAVPLPGEKVVAKQSLDAFLGTDLHEHLRGAHEEVLDRYPFAFSRTTAAGLDADREDWDRQLRGLATVSR